MTIEEENAQLKAEVARMMELVEAYERLLKDVFREMEAASNSRS